LTNPLKSYTLGAGGRGLYSLTLMIVDRWWWLLEAWCLYLRIILKWPSAPAAHFLTPGPLNKDL